MPYQQRIDPFTSFIAQVHHVLTMNSMQIYYTIVLFLAQMVVSQTRNLFALLQIWLVDKKKAPRRQNLFPDGKSGSKMENVSQRPQKWHFENNSFYNMVYDNRVTFRPH